MAAAKSGSEGGGVAGVLSFQEGVKIYQLDDTGVIVGVSITGAKYTGIGMTSLFVYRPQQSRQS